MKDAERELREKIADMVGEYGTELLRAINERNGMRYTCADVADRILSLASEYAVGSPETRPEP